MFREFLHCFLSRSYHLITILFDNVSIFKFCFILCYILNTEVVNWFVQKFSCKNNTQIFCKFKLDLAVWKQDEQDLNNAYCCSLLLLDKMWLKTKKQIKDEQALLFNMEGWRDISAVLLQVIMLLGLFALSASFRPFGQREVQRNFFSDIHCFLLVFMLSTVNAVNQTLPY